MKESKNMKFGSSSDKIGGVSTSASANSWKGKAQTVISKKTVTYKCGCTVVLGGYGGADTAPHTCVQHHEPISEITTNDRFVD